MSRTAIIICSTAAAMLAFAANSILARAALLGPIIDPASFTAIRIVSGALMLVVLVGWSERALPRAIINSGDWVSAFCLFSYAAAFSFAYVKLETGIGALILFAMVQVTMIGWALAKGGRLSVPQWAGFIIAFGAFIWLVSPGMIAPDPFNALLMVASGIAWGAYSLRGRDAKMPLCATAGNFVLAVPMAAALCIPYLSAFNLGLYGVFLAVCSGAITSAIGYTIWYRVLPQISATQGSIVQLSVPVLAGFGGFLISGEAITPRFTTASIFILGGIALFTLTNDRRN